MQEAFGREFAQCLRLKIGGQNLVEHAEALTRELEFFDIFRIAHCLNRKEFIEQIPERDAGGFGFFVLQTNPDKFQERHVVAIAEEFESLPSNGHPSRGEVGQVAAEMFLTTLKELCRGLGGSLGLVKEPLRFASRGKCRRDVKLPAIKSFDVLRFEGQFSWHRQCSYCSYFAQKLTIVDKH